ncbi:MAG: SAM-dependent methyltransferase [Deltaproteobacteria bacterium HGW-Deltaproteobacteria-4]|nr:MAG: SAM-dependent methyltransferase [Deltaproteobacteria bacterium HGW-Deltaproteobacteria-4]
MNWDERYACDDYIYGKEPNDFLRSCAGKIPAGKVLTLAEGEGRNAVYLAAQGYEVTAVDNSSVALEKARQLAAERNVSITTIHADLGDFTIEADEWEGIISCFCHLPVTLRASLHQAVVRGLKPGGMLVFEGFSKEQLSYGTGGPQSLDLLMKLEELQQELVGLKFVHAVQVEREVREGLGHTGLAAVVQLLGIKP